MEIVAAVAANVATTLIDTAKTEVSYLCCFNAQVKSFEDRKERLTTIRSELLKHIEEAKRRNETQVEVDVQRWLDEADVIIQEDKKARKKWFHGWRPDCFRQLRQGKKLAEKMQHIEDLIVRTHYFYSVSHQAETPGLQFHSRSNFIDFESRKSRFEELVEALECGNYNMIGLQSLGGMGKTTLAQQVGARVVQSKAFEKVIFTVVSNHQDISRIQADIASHLDLSLEGRDEAEHSKILWSTIAHVKGRLLIILDDVWSAVNLNDIGIPFDNDYKNCCVLVTTRDVGVCREMRCQLTIHLQTLSDEEALNLLMTHVNYDDLRNDLQCLATAIAKECEGLPIAIVAIERSLRNRSVYVWKDALRTLQDSQPWVGVDEDFTMVYRCFQLSYDRLRDENAKKLFLLCSLLPKDYEIRISLLISLAIGAGMFGEIYKYWEARCQALEVKNKLIDSSLLLKVEKGGVKMHKLVREAAWWIAKEDTQMIMNSKATPNSNLRFLFWSGYDFPNQFHCMKLEVLFLWIKGYVEVEDANANFEEMESLRVLFLCCDAENHLILRLQSFLGLKNIRTLILNGWELNDISILKNMQSLETLELNDCSIIELAKEIKDLKKLKLLGLRRCSIAMNNPFEVIGRCSQLEELYFVDNGNVENWLPDSDRENIDKVSQDMSPALQIYSIACSGLEYFDDDDNDKRKCFNTKNVMNLISGSMFQYLVEKAEVLEWGGMEGTRWRSLVPDIIPVKDGAMNDLIKLFLYEQYDVGYLIDASELVSSDVTVFSKLVELHMIYVEVEGLCLGPIPSGFLQQLRVLKLSRCRKLLNIFLDGSLKLPHLKVLKLENCPMFQPSIFKRCVAASLEQLEELVIEDCAELSSLIDDESLGDKMVVANHQNNYDLLFPSLQTLEINGCDKLEMVSRLLLAGDLPLLRDLSIRYCGKLKYVFGEYRHEGHLPQLTLLPSLTEINLYWVPSLINLFGKCEKWVQKPPPTVKDDSKQKHASSKTRAADANIADPKAKVQTISLESRGSMKGIEIVFSAECLLRAPLYFRSMRQMKLWEVSKIRSLFSVHIAETTMLEELEISYCEELEHIITNDGEVFDHKNSSSIFPKLQKVDIYNCDSLEFIFPSTLSGGLQKLKYVTIDGAFKLKYVFGNLSNDKNDELHIDLPALEALSLEEVPNMVSICINSYRLKSDAAKATKMHMQNVTSPAGAKKSEIEEIMNVERPSSKYGFNFNNVQQISIRGSQRLKTLFSISTWRSLQQLSKLYIWECDFLRSVVEDDSKDHGLHINHSSIFPKLEDLRIRECMKLEFILPSFLSGDLQKLKHLVVKEAPKLKYIFGKHYDEDHLTGENESDEVQVDLSALETLSLAKVPNMINICAQRHTTLKLPSLQKIALDNCQELTMSARPSAHSTLYWKPVAAKDLMRVIMQQQKLTSLEVEECTTEEIFNFEEYGEVEGSVARLNLEIMRLIYLRELRYICRSRKYVLRLPNLCTLEIKSCQKLRVVFSASMSKSLPQLSHLRIEDCPELVHLIEWDDDEDHLHQHCFPKLEYIGIERCDRLKFLFSISASGILPKLHSLQIVEACELVQVFTCEEDDIRKMALKDAFPTLSTLILRELPCLVTICGWINFHTLQDFEVVDCPRYQGPQDKAATMELPSAQEMPDMGTNFEKTSTQAIGMRDDEQAPIPSISPVSVIESIEGGKKAEKKVGTVAVPDLELTSPKVTEMPSPGIRESSKQAMVISDEEEAPILPILSVSSELAMGISDDEEAPIPLVSSAACSMKETDELVFEVHDGLKEAIITRKQSDVPLYDSLGNDFALSRETVGGIEVSSAAPSLHSKFANMDVTLQEALQEHDISKVQSADSESRKQSAVSLVMAEIDRRNKETMKQGLQDNYALEETARIIQSADSSDLTKESLEPFKLSEKDFAEIVRRIEETVKQKLQENYTPEEAVMRVIQSPSSDVRKQSKEPFLKLSQDFAQGSKEVSKKVEVTATEMPQMSTPFEMGFQRSLTIKETRDASVEERPMSVKHTSVNISNDVISSLHRPLSSESQIGSASSSSSSTFEIGEILKLVELKDDERALLVKTLELYPKLRLSHRHRPVVAFAYRVLIDILMMLSTKNPYTITEADKSTLEANLGAANYFGFDEDWVESVRAKIFGMDMVDILATREKMLVMEAEIEAHDSALGQMRKERAEAKERLAMARRKMEISQSEFEVIDSQMLGLLVDYKLITKMLESGEASTKGGTFGI